MLAALLLWALAAPLPAVETAPDFGGSIAIPAEAGATLRVAGRELAETLTRLTGVTYAMGGGDGSGIVLALTSSASVPAEAVIALRQAGREPCWFHAEGRRRLWLVANGEEGLVLGIYTWLDQLGCRWLLPNERWTHIPRRQGLEPPREGIIRPAFQRRTFFGTGGFGPPSPMDPGGDLPKRWEDWKRRNRFGGEYRIGGHTWEAFITRHQAEFAAHPEFLALRDGQRGGSKLCVSNPALIDLYVADRIQALAREAGEAPIISIEPSDGYGHCTCPACLALGEPAEVMQVFSYANAVARRVAADSPQARVGIMAYAGHAAVPALDLAPNLVVQVVPYAFQRTGLSGDDLLRAWGRTGVHLEAYDYWSITDWARNVPAGDLAVTAARRIRSWRDAGVRGTNLETTSSGGAMGLELFVAARLLLDPDADDRALVGEFITTAFGPAAPPMRRMLTRWARRYGLNRLEMARTYADLSEACILAAADPVVLPRLADWSIYVEYLRRRMEWRFASPEERDSRLRRLAVHIWRSLPSGMVHSYRIAQLLATREVPEAHLGRLFDPRDGQGEGWREATPITGAEALSWIREGAAAYPSVGGQPAWEGRLQPLTVDPVSTGLSPAILLGEETVAEFEAPERGEGIMLRLRMARKEGQSNQIRVEHELGDVVLDQQVPADGVERDLPIPVPQPGRYVLTMIHRKTLCRVQFPLGVHLTFRRMSCQSASPRLHFLVPRGTRQVVMAMDRARSTCSFLDPSGADVEAALSDVATFPVPSGADGKVWALQHLKGQLPSGGNTPPCFALAADDLMVPEGGP